VLNDYTLAGDLDRQFGDLSVGLRKILLSMIHGFARTPGSLLNNVPHFCSRILQLDVGQLRLMLARERPAVGPIQAGEQKMGGTSLSRPKSAHPLDQRWLGSGTQPELC
jgi:hypothetical protein